MELIPHRHMIGITRREFLQVGYSGLLGITMGQAAQAASAASGSSAKSGKPRSMIVVFLTGGPSHLDTFDLKPGAPAEVRGEFKPIDTNVSGIQICEHLPQIAKRMDRLALIRSMTHLNNGHLPATHWVLTGHAIPGIPESSGQDKIRSRTDWPSYGSAVSYFRPPSAGLPSCVNLPTYLQEGALLWPGQYAGTLGPKYDPWQITDDPNKKDFKVPGLSLPAGFSLERLNARKTLLERVNGEQERLSSVAETRVLSDQQRDAFTLLTSSRFAEAFQIDREPDAVRDRYGRHMYGQSLLLARRLVEAGVPVVQANMGIVQTWDTHGQNWTRLKNSLLPPLDQGYTALLDDLKDRGLIDSTLVVLVGDFGRSPKINGGSGADAGRDHWCEVFSAVLTGAGVRGGQVIGASDPMGGSPATQGFTPDDLGATIYQTLGIDPASEFIDREGRPNRLNTGKVMETVFTGAGV